MLNDPKFGPAAQTPEQRAWVLHQMLDAIPGLKRGLNSRIRLLHARYIAGELSWIQMRLEMDQSLHIQ
jgi:hypothetical protein